MNVAASTFRIFRAIEFFLQGVFVDLGFGKFFELFEQRFGRKAASVLLLATGIALLATCGSIFWEKVVLPCLWLYQSSDVPGLKLFIADRLVPALFSVGLIALIGSFFFTILERVFLERRLSKAADAVTKKVNKQTDEYIEQRQNEVMVSAYDLIERLKDQSNEHIEVLAAKLRNEMDVEVTTIWDRLYSTQGEIATIIDELKVLLDDIEGAPENARNLVKDFLSKRGVENEAFK